EEEERAAAVAHSQEGERQVAAAERARWRDEERRRREEEAREAELALGGGGDIGDEGDEEEEEPLMDVRAQATTNAQWSQVHLMKEGLEERLAAQTYLIYELIAGLRMRETSDARLQFPANHSPTLSLSISEVDVTRGITKSVLASIPKYEGLGGAQKLYEFIQHVKEYLDLVDLPAKEQFVVAMHKLTGAASMMM
ncbi:hypothetical protein HK104_001644, partial [Borealophlyctis nickersoniae]